MNLKNLVFTLLALWGMAAKAQHTVTISGTVDCVGDVDRVVVQENNGFEHIVVAETAIKPDHTFSMKVTRQKPGALSVMACDAQSVRVWVDDEDISIHFQGVDTASVRVNKPRYIPIRGGKKNQLVDLFNFSSAHNYYLQQEMAGLVSDLELEDASLNKAISGVYDVTNQELTAEAKHLLEVYGDLPSAMVLMPYVAKDEAYLEQALQRLEKANPGTKLASDYRAKRADVARKKAQSEVGQPAPDLTFPNEKGKMVSLSSLKGKVVIVDFWASWCGPCRAETPKLKAIYEDYKGDKRVAFVSISIDEKKAAWTKALAEEQTPWINLLAPNSGREAMDKYQFNGIPFIICIDKDGKIFRKQLRGDAIRKAIEDALK